MQFLKRESYNNSITSEIKALSLQSQSPTSNQLFYILDSIFPLSLKFNIYFIQFVWVICEDFSLYSYTIREKLRVYLFALGIKKSDWVGE